MRGNRKRTVFQIGKSGRDFTQLLPLSSLPRSITLSSGVPRNARERAELRNGGLAAIAMSTMNSPRATWKRSCALLLLLMSMAVTYLSAQEAAADAERGLSDTTLEQLMDIQVSSVTPQEQRLIQTAAAVYVLTREDIRRSGANNLPDLLRLVPGLQVASIDANKWAVTSRGFNGRFANKLLVLVDGRSVYNSVFSGVFWEQLNILMEDIERVEVIRGPGAAMWGINAVNGVINIITRAAKDSVGGFLAAGAGATDRALLGARYGAPISDRAHYRLSMKYLKRTEFATPAGGDAQDDWQSLGGFFRLDYDRSPEETLSLRGDVYRSGGSQTINAAFLSPIVRPIEDEVNSAGGSAMLRWEKRPSEGNRTTVQTYYDYWQRDEYYGDGGYHTLDTELQQHWQLDAKNNLAVGAGYRLVRGENLAKANVSFVPEGKTTHLFSLFGQHEFQLVPDRWVATLGFRLQHNSYSGIEYQPSLRTIWTPSTRQSLWWSVSRALVSPSRAFHDVRFEFDPGPFAPLGAVGKLTGNPEAQAPSVWSYEAGYRTLFGTRLTLDFATFYSQLNHDFSVTSVPPFLEAGPLPRLVIPLKYDNGLKGDSYGGEAVAGWSAMPWWQLNAGYGWLRTSIRPQTPQTVVIDGLVDRANQGVSPRHQVHLRSSFELPARLSLDLALQHVSRLRATLISARTRLDGRLSWQFTRGGELSLGVANALDNQTLEFRPEDYSIPSEVKRSVYTKLDWRF